jgi:ADP-ribose pyrophosphatase
MEFNEKMLSRKTIFNGKVFTVYEDTVILQNENQASREVVKHSGGVGIVAINQKNEVFLVKQFRYAASEVLLEIPAGKLEIGEKPEDCGVRELLEETGYSADKLISLGFIYPTPAYCNEKIYIYFVRVKGEQGSQNLDKDEFLSVHKIPLDKAIQKILEGEITDAKTIVALLKTSALISKGLL